MTVYNLYVFCSALGFLPRPMVPLVRGWGCWGGGGWEFAISCDCLYFYLIEDDNFDK